jgi:hypothetical protein
MTRLYTTPLPDSQATTSDEGVRTQIQQSGLLEAGGTATEKISAENIDLVAEGTFEFGARFSRKLATELESLGESDYSGLPFYDPGGGGRTAGYYELEQVDVSPSHPVNEDAFEYTVGLKFTGTRQDVWSGVATNSEDVQTGLATGSNSLVGVPAGASKVRWYSESAGKEPASVVDTVTGEFGRVDRYDPNATSITNPMLLYELPYRDTGGMDVRVYDDHNLDKYFEVVADSEPVSTTTLVGSADVGGVRQRASQWTHAYHTSYEFEGRPVVDNGLLRVRFDEAEGVVEAYEWDTSTTAWSALSVNHGDYELVDADFEEVGPMDVRVYTEWYDTVDDRLEQAIISVQRGLKRGIARYPSGTTQTSGLESVLSGFVGDYATDNKPGRSLEARGEVK